jgi:hypothetical protein
MAGAVALLLLIALWFRRGIIAWGIFVLGGSSLNMQGGYPFSADWAMHAMPDCGRVVRKSMVLVVDHPCLAAGPSDRFWMDVEIGHTVYRGPYLREIAVPAAVFCDFEVQGASPRVRIADLDQGRWFGWSNKEAYDLRETTRLSIRLLAWPVGDGTSEMLLEME